MNTDPVGLLAATLTTFAFVPQVLKVWRTRSADDLSWWMLAVFGLGNGLWLAYGLRLMALPIILGSTITLILVAMLVVFKQRFAPQSGAGSTQ